MHFYLSLYEVYETFCHQTKTFFVHCWQCTLIFPKPKPIWVKISIYEVMCDAHCSSVYCISLEVAARCIVLSNIVCGNAKLDFDVLLHTHTPKPWWCEKKGLFCWRNCYPSTRKFRCGPFDVRNRAPRVFPSINGSYLYRKKHKYARRQELLSTFLLLFLA